MNTQTYKGTIRLKTTSTIVNVQCDALSPSSAKKIIEAQYDVKSWAKQMSSK